MTKQNSVRVVSVRFCFLADCMVYLHVSIVVPSLEPVGVTRTAVLYIKRVDCKRNKTRQRKTKRKQRRKRKNV